MILSNIQMILVAYATVMTVAIGFRTVAAAPDRASIWNCRNWIRTEDNSWMDLSCVDTLEVAEAVFPGEAAAIVELGTGLSARYLSVGDIRKAELSAIRALQLAQSRLDRLDPLRAISMTRLATVFRQQARYQESEWLIRKALELGQVSLRDNPQELANLHENLAMLELVHGRYDAAITMLRRVREIRASQGQTAVSMGVTLFALASALEQHGTLTEAIHLYEQAATLFRAKYGPMSPQVALCILNSARSLQRDGRLAEAEPIYKYALNILQQNPHVPPHDIARAYTELGLLYQAQGGHARAQSLLQQGLTLREKNLGGSHPLVAESLIGVALGHLHLGEVPASIPLLWRAIANLESGLRLPLSEARTTSLLEQHQNIENAIYGGLLKFPASTELKQLAMAAALLRKGRSEDAGRRTNRATLAPANTRARVTRLADWQTARAEFEQLILQGPGALSPVAYHARFDELRLKIEDLEHALLSETGFRDALSIPGPKDIVSKVASQLDKSSILLEFVSTRPLLATASASDAARYVALILDSGGKIDVRDLGDTSTIDRQIGALLGRLQDRGLDPQPAAQSVYQALFSPMKDSFRSTGRIYVSPDGSLHLIPFAALHDGNNYLIERYQFIYLSSGRDLLEHDHRVAGGPPVVVADPEFAADIQSLDDGLASPSALTRKDVTANRGTAGLYSTLTTAARLPGTRKEARLLSELWPDAKLLLGRDAEEKQVRRIAAPLFLHLATHGVFLEDQPNTAPGPGGQSARALIPLAMISGASEPAGLAEGVASMPQSLPGGDLASALSRSALLLAGVEFAYRSRDRYHDGLLTADEVREMNLWGTKLVVLSACDSGRGAIRIGQGVYGLRRAFFTAGAETLVTSLWRVADAETSELMDEYYQRLSEGGSRIGALGAAMAAVRKRHPHPYYWAPFIGIGRDAPLNDAIATKLQDMPLATPGGAEPVKQPPIEASGAHQRRQTMEGGSIHNPEHTTNPLWGLQGSGQSPSLPARVQVFLVGPSGIILEPADRRSGEEERIDKPTDSWPPGCLPPCGRWYPRRYQFRIRSASLPEIDWFSLANPHRQVTIHYRLGPRSPAARKVGGALLGVGGGALAFGLVLMGAGAANHDLFVKPFVVGCGLSITGTALTIVGGTLFGVNRTTVSVRQGAGAPEDE